MDSGADLAMALGPLKKSLQLGVRFDVVMRIMIIVGMMVLTSSADAMTDPAPSTGIVRSLDSTNKKITIAIDKPLTVTGETATSIMNGLSVGDVVRFGPPTIDGMIAADSLSDINAHVDVPVPQRCVAAFAAFAVIFSEIWFFSGRTPTKFLVGVDGRTSNSQTQLALWSVAVLGVYLTTLLLRACYGWQQGASMIGGAEIPTNLLAISGLSGLTFAGARAITVSKNDAAKSAAATAAATIAGAGPSNSGAVATVVSNSSVNGNADPILNAATAAAACAGKLPTLPGKPPAFLDLFQDDAGNMDLGDTQMILITFTAIAIYFVKSFAFLGTLEMTPHVTLPDVDTYLLASFGIGQGAYLAKKAASDPGKG